MNPETLKSHAKRLQSAPMRELIAEQGRDAALIFEAGGLIFDARRQRIDLEAWRALLGIAAEAGLNERFAALFRGDIVNSTEKRPSLHPACRNPARLCDPALAARMNEARRRTRAFSLGFDNPEALDGHPLRRVVNIGIGGSDLGPRFVYDALKAFRREEVEARFVSNLDPADLDDALEGADPETTLVIAVSKSFTTQETLLNAQAAREWLASRLGEAGADARFAAATAAPDKAAAFGIAPERIFPFEDGVGGRYSFWSPAGLSIELAIGANSYARLLDGARHMDDHVLDAPLASNIAIVKALVDIWNRAGRGRPSRLVAAYSSRLERLPAYLQQLEMESLGKSVDTAGSPLPPNFSGPLVWGGRGSDLQHSAFQWLHQGQDETPADFIALNDPAFMADKRARALNANLAAQTAALTQGRPAEGALGAHTAIEGGRASSTILLPGLIPESVGALVALHEHKVYAEGVLYGLNPFDQWGVELGKTLAHAMLSGDMSGFDPVARDLARRLGLDAD